MATSDTPSISAAPSSCPVTRESRWEVLSSATVTSLSIVEYESRTSKIARELRRLLIAKRVQQNR